jgi:hypothetical protein
VLLAAAWCPLVLHARGAVDWWRGGWAAGGIGGLLVLASVASVMLFETAGAVVSQMLTFATWLWTVVAPILALRVPARSRPMAGGWPHVVAGVLFAVALVLAFAAMELVLPPGS